MRSSEGAWDLAEWLERLTANAKVATVLNPIITVESEESQLKQNVQKLRQKPLLPVCETHILKEL